MLPRLVPAPLSCDLDIICLLQAWGRRSCTDQTLIRLMIVNLTSLDRASRCKSLILSENRCSLNSAMLKRYTNLWHNRMKYR